MPRLPYIRPTASRLPARLALGAWCALAILAALLGCGSDKVAGTSSGVDNPALTVSFRDADNSAARITGDLDVYSSDQNPALDPEPLVTIKIKNSSFTNLTGDDFKRAAATSSAAPALNKRAAADTAPTTFNLVLKTQDRNGGFILGLRYDPAAKSFTRRGDSVIKSIAVTPKPLVRYEARIAREAVHGDAGRIFVPGSPFLATLVDSVFVIEDVPEGEFPLRLIAGDGKVYPIGDSLNTLDSARIYRPGIVPVGSLDTSHPVDTIPAFSIKAQGARTVFMGEPVILEAGLSGIPASDPRVSILWRWLKEGADSLGAHPVDTAKIPKDTLPPRPGAKILTPTSLRTEVRFSAEGVYRMAVTATVGIKTAFDTMTVAVVAPTPPKPRIITPRPSDSLLLGKPYNIQWEMAAKGPYTIEATNNNGEKWIQLATHYMHEKALQVFPWTPARELGAASRCLIRVTDEADPAHVAVMEGPFHLIQ